MKYDVAVVGAGAAGLSAARDLCAAGKRVCLIEASERIGGRILTRHVPGIAIPIELGAEFIHGEAHSTFSIVESAGLQAVELPENHGWSRGGRFQMLPDFWADIEKVESKIRSLRRDISFDEFLRTRPSIPPRLRELSRNFVEGYHAAHADRMSAMSLTSSDSEQDGDNKQFRILQGQDALIEWLLAGLDPERCEVFPGTVVSRVIWRRGRVTIEADARIFEATAAIFTLPIGVWKAPRDQSGSILFDPELHDKQTALGKLEVGHIVKILFRFAERFWDEPDFVAQRMSAKKSAPPLNFIHSSDRFVPTWWTSSPVRSPLLTGWAGGPAADALLANAPETRIDRALDSLAAVFRMPRKRIDALLRGSWTHDWQSDPFIRGAYSYPGVGGRNAHKALARPSEETLFFAGEATNGEQTGTVAGAIESGRRAAKEVLGKG